MRTSTLLARNLAWYWRTNLAVLLGVAAAAGVLGGALLVGDSVRATLRDLLLARLGSTQYVVARNGFFREELAAAIGNSAPLIATDGVVSHESGAVPQDRAGRPRPASPNRVEVYGVDERFWKFQGLPGEPPRGRDILLTPALARELNAKQGETILLRVEKPSAIPRESLHGRKEDVGKTIRLVETGLRSVAFSLRPQQGDVRAVYVALAFVQRELGETGRANTIVAGDVPDIERRLKERYSLADLGLTLRSLDKPSCLALESDNALVNDAVAGAASKTAKSLGLRTEPILTYLANSIRAGGHEIPYSVVTALDTELAPAQDDGIVLNAWAARDLAAKPGDAVSLEYYVWKSDGRLHTESAAFRLERVVPILGAAADRNLTPDYPGITGSKSLRDWDPPFPLSLARVRPADEQYWKEYRTTPKAFIRLARGRGIWGTRFGSLTSIRITPPSEAYAAALRAAIEPGRMGLAAVPVKAQGLKASEGSTDFGEYFVYFSFFLMVSALLLAGLFFRLGVEQRMREIGVLRALGFSLARIRLLFLLEGGVLAIAGALAGVAASLGYGALMLFGLGAWWFDAVGTRLLSLHASIPPLALGAVAGVATGLAAIAFTLRGLAPVTPRGLIAGERPIRPARKRVALGAIAALLAFLLLAAAFARKLDQTAAFFGAGTLLLIAALVWESAWLRGRSLARIRGQFTLGFRSAAYRPGRSILCIALIASATFLIVSLDAFRRQDSAAGTGGFALVAESALPLIHDPNSPAGRDALNIPPLPGVEFVPFRLRPGDDASCLNLYQPRNPAILGAPATFLRDARFPFEQAVAKTPNPWLLLEAPEPDGAIPAIADANSMTYVLHRKLGEEFTLDHARFRIVAALQDSLFQSELLISERNFLSLFPDAEGYRFFLIQVGQAPGLPGGRTVHGPALLLEDALRDYGFRAQPAQARLANFHKVENTYLSIFSALGALGLVLGTVGLAAVLLRNVLERRKELALLRAVGYCPRHIATMVLAENALLLLAGLATGTVCALLAVAPAAASRGGHLPVLSLGVLLAAVLATGIVASLAATAIALRSPLLAALRSE